VHVGCNSRLQLGRPILIGSRDGAA